MRHQNEIIEKQFARRFWKGVLISVCSAAGIVITLLAIGLIAYYGQKYNW